MRDVLDRMKGVGEGRALLCVCVIEFLWQELDRLSRARVASFRFCLPMSLGPLLFSSLDTAREPGPLVEEILMIS